MAPPRCRTWLMLMALGRMAGSPMAVGAVECGRRRPQEGSQRLRQRLAEELPDQASAAEDLAKSLHHELEMSPQLPKVYALFGERSAGVRSLADAVVTSFYPKTAPALVCLDMQDVIATTARHSAGGLERGKGIIKQAVHRGIRTCGQDAVVLIHHMEALRGENLRLLDALLEVFNGERSYLQYEGEEVHGGGVIFLLLFETSQVVPGGPSGHWRSGLERWWAYRGEEMTTSAHVGRITQGIVLKSTPAAGLPEKSLCEVRNSTASPSQSLLTPAVLGAGVGVVVIGAMAASYFFSRDGGGGGGGSTVAGGNGRSTERTHTPQGPPKGPPQPLQHPTASPQHHITDIRGGHVDSAHSTPDTRLPKSNRGTPTDPSTPVVTGTANRKARKVSGSSSMSSPEPPPPEGTPSVAAAVKKHPRNKNKKAD